MKTINETCVTDILFLRAAKFIQDNNGQHLSTDRLLLLGRTANHLEETMGCSRYTAERAAVRALAEYECKGVKAYIDVNESTSYAVFVKDAVTKRSRMFTVKDLLSLPLDMPSDSANNSLSAATPN